MMTTQHRQTERGRAALHRALFLLLPAMLALGAAACEETVSADDVPYVEQMIVQGLLTADSTNDTIRFVRTLPLSRPYDPMKAELTGVIAEIAEAPTGTVYPLVAVARGAYVARGLRPQVGMRYTLTASWKNEQGSEYRLTGSTTVPLRATIGTVRSRARTDTTSWVDGVGQPGYYIEASVLPTENVAYGLSYEMVNGSFPGFKMMYSFLYDDILRRKVDADEDGILRLKPGEWSGTLHEPPPYATDLEVHAFDMSYYDYYITRHSSNDDEVFGSPGEKTRWNVTGDGFGVFTSRSISGWRGVVE